MKEIVQQKYWVHSRGVEVLLPPHSTRAITEAKAANLPIPELESERLKQIESDGTLKRRYPTPEVGREFMGSVCFKRREKLLDLAGKAVSEIKTQWDQVNPDKPIAIVIFGSVAKGTVKGINTNDPSNIDLAVIGDINEEETEMLFDKIRPFREETQQSILSDHTEVSCDDVNPGNLGVSVQHIKKLSNGSFSGSVTYIGSSAFPLYDPEGIWHQIETEALTKLHAQTIDKKPNLYVRDRSWRDAARKVMESTHRSETQTRDVNETVVFTQPRLF
jgi:hypothetical protein